MNIHNMIYIDKDTYIDNVQAEGTQHASGAREHMYIQCILYSMYIQCILYSMYIQCIFNVYVFNVYYITQHASGARLPALLSALGPEVYIYI